MNIELPPIFLKVGDTVLSYEQVPHFWKEKPRTYYDNWGECTPDPEARTRWLDFVTQTVRTMLERSV